MKDVLKSPATKAMIAFVIVVGALVFALWPRNSAPTTGWTAPSGGVTDEAVSEEMMAEARTGAALAPCPTGAAPVPPASVLTGVRAECLADGQPLDVGAATAGKPTVINLWAVWCLPCRKELPYFQQLADRTAGELNVLAVHAKDGADKPYAILRFLQEVGVHLPTVADLDGDVAKVLKAPRVYPSSILVRADGTVAAVLPQVFDTYDDLAGAVSEHLGVNAS